MVTMSMNGMEYVEIALKRAGIVWNGAEWDAIG